MKLNLKKSLAVIMTVVMCLSASACNSSGEMSDEELQALIDSAVASAEQEAKDYAEEHYPSSVITNSGAKFAPSEEILSADIYSGKVQLQDKVFTYPFTINDLEAAGIDTGISLDYPAGSYFQDMIRVGNGYVQTGRFIRKIMQAKIFLSLKEALHIASIRSVKRPTILSADLTAAAPHRYTANIMKART